mmetsp:Transcript_313/g.753  ORF Transcript_313/g.753 Transcript_313/m.753 type:complete len:212 (+) Transcript_313:1121-1756(+)
MPCGCALLRAVVQRETELAGHVLGPFELVPKLLASRVQGLQLKAQAVVLLHLLFQRRTQCVHTTAVTAIATATAACSGDRRIRRALPAAVQATAADARRRRLQAHLELLRLRLRAFPAVLRIRECRAEVCALGEKCLAFCDHHLEVPGGGGGGVRGRPAEVRGQTGTGTGGRAHGREARVRGRGARSGLGLGRQTPRSNSSRPRNACGCEL